VKKRQKSGGGIFGGRERIYIGSKHFLWKISIVTMGEHVNQWFCHKPREKDPPKKGQVVKIKSGKANAKPESKNKGE